ncbi:Ig-like domain repeat protein [Methanosphaera sp. ISO3-F5]|uniref:Ig-like domain repeat protein n=1 Tax=Methanosphaera sp. ISO3-F5 TaxID=1452353 RepID=UPI002B25C4FA|nr:Ig-like domain repeat protein [Methanosphaera sp. ISO3-F5]WQH63950.1 carboxypeptidase regulatory-like domain-containing protein [Methanosphaera sp. ISO3-F5]
MTFNKKHCLIFLIITVILTISMTAVSATNNQDTNNTQEINDNKLSTPNNYDVDKIQNSVDKSNTEANVQKTENNQNNILSENKKIIKNSQTNKKTESTPENVNNYSQLHNLLTTSTAEDLTVNLLGTDTYTITERIIVSKSIKNLTINGNSITIDGKEQYGFLTINKGLNLTINELIVKNCYDDWNDGAVIHDSESSNITILNSFFENNYMDNDCKGGVLYQNSENFAIITINNTTFKSNFAYGDGGVIYINNPTNLTISNSIFEGNKANDEYLSQGGAIYQSNSGKSTPFFLTIENTNFTSNFAFYMGGSIFSNANNVIINDSSFYDNSVTDLEESYGGALYVNVVELNNCNFTENRASGAGGAIIYDFNLTANDCNFTNNTASSGGAIASPFYRYFFYKDADGNAIYDDSLLIGYTNINNSKFVNNKAEKGAVLCHSTPLYIGDEDEGYRVDKENNMVYYTDDNKNIISTPLDTPTGNNITITNSEFTDNEAQTLGGVIYLDNRLKTEISGNNFTNNKAEKAGVISSENGEVIIKESNFTSNYATSNSTIISIKDTLVTVEDNLFDSNWVGSSEGWVFTLTEDTKINNNLFVNNTDNKRDMLFNILAGEVKGNIYIDNYLNDTITAEDALIDADYHEDIILDLRDVYNDTIRNGTLKVYINENTTEYLTANVTDGKASIEIKMDDLPEKVNNITLKYITLSKHYQNITKTFKLTKNMMNSHITVSANESVKIGENVTINGTLTKDNQEQTPIQAATIKLYINNIFIEETSTGSDGKYGFNYPTTSIGTHNVTVNYTGEGIIQASSNKTTFNVQKIKTNITLTATSPVQAGNKTQITGKLVDEDNQPINGTTVIIYVDGEKVANATTDKDGIYNYNYSTGIVGTHNVTVTYAGNNKYNSSNATTNFQTIKIKADIDLTLPEDATVKSLVNITGKVTDTDGNVLSNLPVNVTVNNKTVPTTTDSRGNYIVTGVNVVLGENNVTVTAGNSTVEAQPVNGTFTARKVKTTITINPLQDTIIGDNVTITGKLVDEDNQPINNATIIIKVDNVNVANVTTGNDGVYNLNYSTRILGTHNVTSTYNGNNTYNGSNTSTSFESIIINANIGLTLPEDATVKSLVNITGKVTDTDGNVLSNLPVNVTVNNKTVPTTTDSSGNYIVTGVSVVLGENNVTVTAGNSTVIAQPVNGTFTVRKVKTTITIDPLQDTIIGDNITITGKLVDEQNNPIVNTNTTITIDDLTILVITDENGNIVSTIQANTLGQKTITIEYAGNNVYSNSKNNTKVNVIKDNATLTVNKPTNAVPDKPVTITGKLYDKNGKPVANIPVNVTINDKTLHTVTDANGNYEVIADNIVSGVNNVTVTSDNYKYNTKSAQEKFNAEKMESHITVNKISDQKMDEKTITITGKLVDEQQNPINNAPVTVKVNNNTYTVTTDKSGNYKYVNPETIVGRNNVTVKYDGDDYKSSTASTTFTIKKVKTIVTVESIKAVVGEDITFTAHVTDEFGNKVTGGNLVFKVNGRTLRVDGHFNTNNTSPLKLSVEDGIVTITLKAELYLRDGKNITASYSGSSKYEEAKANTAEMSVTKRYAQVTVNVTPKMAKQNSDIVFTATLRDVTKNATNKTCLTIGGDVIFKINGVTIKENGKVKRINATSTVINYAYHVPSGMGGYDANGQRNYTVEAVYNNSMYYPGARGSNIFNVQRSIVNINFLKTTLKGNVLSVKATFTDYENKYLVGQNKVCVKINGVTYKENGKAKYFTVSDGKVDLTGIKVASGTKVKSVMLVTGAREGYLGARETTTSIS